jgi:hypothetical protein
MNVVSSIKSIGAGCAIITQLIAQAHVVLIYIQQGVCPEGPSINEHEQELEGQDIAMVYETIKKPTVFETLVITNQFAAKIA